MTGWSSERQRRYAHHVLLPDIGGRGHDRIAATTVAIDIDGRGGQLVALYLAAAGVGVIELVGGQAVIARASFPFGAGEVGTCVRDAITAAITARNPDVHVVSVDAATGPLLAISDDHAQLHLDDALVRGGEVAARWLHAAAQPPRPL